MAEFPDAPPARTRLIVLFGGQSAEHEVSRSTARHVLAAVDRDRYDIFPVGITPEGAWVLAQDTVRALEQGPEALPELLTVAGPALDPIPTVTPTAGEKVVVLPLLHGPMGEDGTVQGMLELAGVAYVGSGVLASALAMDKSVAKQVCASVGLAQARFLALRESDTTPRRPALTRIRDELGLPVFVKPANMGSSIGVSKAGTLAELESALDVAFSYDVWVVVEEFVRGREIEVAVLGNTEPRASVPGEVVPGADFYDYEDKYFSGTAHTLVPAPLDDEATASVQALAVEAFGALRCEGMARVDFFYEQPGRGFLLNEINTIPGFTPISMYPKMWEASGLAYPDLIDELVRLAIERHARRMSKRLAH